MPLLNRRSISILAAACLPFAPIQAHAADDVNAESMDSIEEFSATKGIKLDDADATSAQEWPFINTDLYQEEMAQFLIKVKDGKRKTAKLSTSCCTVL